MRADWPVRCALYFGLTLSAHLAAAQSTTAISGKVTARQVDAVHVTFNPHATAKPAVGDSVVFSKMVSGRQAQAGRGSVTEVLEKSVVVRMASGRPDFETTAVIHATGGAAGAAAQMPAARVAPSPTPVTPTAPDSSVAPPAPSRPPDRSDPVGRMPTSPPQGDAPPRVDQPPRSRMYSAPKPPQRYGLIVGTSSSTFALEGADDRVTSRSGFMAGIMVVAPASRSFGVESDIVFAQKGAFFPESDDYTWEQDWIQVSVLAHLRLATSSAAVPYLIAGPSASFIVQCRLRNPDENIGCKDFDAQVKSNDFSAIVGAGLEIGAFTVSARYDYGFANISATPGESVKNRVMSFTAGILFGRSQ